MHKSLIICCLLVALLPVVNAQTCKPESISATTPTSQFVDNHDGTVTDNKTGLMWMSCAEGQIWNGTTCSGNAGTFNWQAALQWVQDVNNGAGNNLNYTDWRMPNIKELASILEEQCSNPAINVALFPDTPSGVFWSSSHPAFNAFNANSAYTAWYVDFNYGDYDIERKSIDHRVRLVRKIIKGSDSID